MPSPRFLCRLVVLSALPVAAVLARVEVDGVGGALRDNVLAHLSLDDATCDAPAWRVRRLNSKADGEVRRALEAFGYYNPVIRIDTSALADCWLTRIAIEAGEPVLLRAVDIAITGEGAADPAFDRLRRNRALEPGKPLRHAAYDAHRRALGEMARRQGYFAAGFTQARIGILAEQDVADITLHLASGPRFRFGPVTFEQDVVRPEFLERFVDFRPGDPYDGTKVEDFYDALLGTGYFATVDLRTLPGTPPDLQVPITVQMTPARRRVFTAGAGYSTDKGVKVRGGYTDRRVNDRGHQFDATALISEVLSEAGASYRLPRRDPRVEWFSIDAGLQFEDTDSKETRIYKVGLKELHRRPRDWIETRFIDAGIERFEIADDRQREFLLIPGVSWSHAYPEDSRVTRPDRGHRVALKLSGTAEAIGSDSEFLQVDLSGKLVWPLWRDARVLLRGEVGATAKDEFRTLPASVRYFAGGDNSVRGYDYESLGPTDDAGQVVGGTHKLIGSVEIDQRVWGNWSLAAFVDAGNAFDSFADVSAKTGVGAGIRWYSPLGPVRVDFAVPLDADAPDDWRLHVTLGPDL